MADDHFLYGEPEKGTPEYEEWLREKRESRMRDAGITKKYFEASFANLIDSDDFFDKRGFSKNEKLAYRRAKKEIKSISSNFEEHLKHGSCFMLLGETGTGKDYFATCLVKDVINSKRTALTIKLDDMMMYLRSKITSDERKAMNRFVQPDLLIINEIGIQTNSDFTWNKVNMIIDDRYNECRPTIIISNLNSDQIKELVGDRIVSRFKEGYSKIIRFNWPDLRLGLTRDKELD
jgi:DNA replication protein DnaC